MTAGPTAGSQAPPAAPVPPRYARHEKHEKQEKQEKHEKGEKQEKGRGGDLAGAITGGLILILLGILLYYASLGTTAVTFGNFLQYFIIGVVFMIGIQGIISYGE